MSLHVSKLLLIGSMSAGLFATSVSAQNPDHKGKVSVTLKNIEALSQTGSPDPAHDGDCKAKFGGLLGKHVVTSYNINSQTLMMSAVSTFEGQQYSLNALGLSGKYAFGVFKPESKLPLSAVLFQISLKFTDPASSLNLNLNSDTSCLVSSNAKAVEGWGGSVPNGPAK